MLLKFPAEILENVLHYCDIRDKRNVACCSKELNTAMEPLLWSTVLVRSDLLASSWHKNLFKKFCHTKRLHFIFYQSNDYIIEDEYNAKPTSASNFNLARVLGAINSNMLTKLIISYLVCDDTFIYIMEKLWFVEHLDLNCVNLVEKTWDYLPSGLTQLRLGSLGSPIFCNITDQALKEVLEKNRLNRLEIYLDFHEGGGVPGLSSESLRHISKAQSIKELEVFLYVPPPVDLTCLSDMQNLTSLSLRGNFCPIDEEQFMSQICQKLQQLEVLIFSALQLQDQSFSNIHMLSSLRKLSLNSMQCLCACSIFHYIKSHKTLCELDFDGETFRELSLGQELEDVRKQELYDDIRVLNQLPKLSKITIMCPDDFDVSPMIVKGLCEKRKWIHQCEDDIHTFHKVFY